MAQNQSYNTPNGQQVYPIQSLPDGRVRYSDGSIGFPQNMSQNGATINTNTPQNSRGELINPTSRDVAQFNDKYTTTRPNQTTQKTTQRNFYKKDGSYYYVDNNQKILNVNELKEASKSGIEVKAPTLPTQGEVAKTNSTNSELQALHDWIDSQSYTAGEKAILHQIANDDSYTSGQKIPSQTELAKIISDAATNATSDTNPYFTKMTDREIQDTKNQLSDIRGGFQRYQAQEATDYKTKLAQTKQDLRARGLTFSGTARQTLGAESAIGANGVEGAVPEQRRLNYESNLANYTGKTRDIGVAAERQLGSSGDNSISSLDFGQYNTPYGSGNFYNPSGNVTTGDLNLQRIKAIEQSKWDRIKQQSPFYFN